MVTNKYLCNFKFLNFLFMSHFALQKFSRKLNYYQEISCMEMKNDSSLYAVGSKSYTLLIDSRSLEIIKKIPAMVLCRGVHKTNYGESATCSLTKQTITIHFPSNFFK